MITYTLKVCGGHGPRCPPLVTPLISMSTHFHVLITTSSSVFLSTWSNHSSLSSLMFATPRERKLEPSTRQNRTSGIRTSRVPGGHPGHDNRGTGKRHYQEGTREQYRGKPDWTGGRTKEELFSGSSPFAIWVNLRMLLSTRFFGGFTIPGGPWRNSTWLSSGWPWAIVWICKLVPPLLKHLFSSIS